MSDTQYKPQMNRDERQKRVLRQLRDNVRRSRQSGAEWEDVLNAYKAYLAANQEAV